MSSVSAARYLPPYYIGVATGAKWVGSTCESSSVSAVCVLPTSYTAVRPSAKCIAGCLFRLCVLCRRDPHVSTWCLSSVTQAR